MNTSDREYQIDNLRRIYSAASMSPVLKRNPKFQVEGTARIGYSDIMEERTIVRVDANFPDSGGFWGGDDAPILASYSSVEELVDDGWRLD